MADAGTGTSGTIRIDVSESAQDAAANTSTVNWAFYLIESSISNSTYGSGKSASVDWVNVTNLWSGTYSFDWRSSGAQTVLIASGSFGTTHNADGSYGVTIQGNIAATGTSGAGGPTSVSQGLALTTLTVVPGSPTGVTATRVSDTQVTLNWSQSNASNGQPTATAIDVSINGAAWVRQVDFGGATSASLSAAANQKLEYRVTSGNAAGYAAWSATSPAIYTTPSAPTNATATKDASLNIVVAFTKNVAYNEYTHEVWHGVVSSGTTTWDTAVLATLASGVVTYTHATPNASQVHIYQVRSRAGTLGSSYATSNSVQLLVAPNKPTVPAMTTISDKATALTFTWVHNPQDTTPQTAYEFSRSVDGGTTWTTSGKVVSTAAQFVVAASTYAANVALVTRVRTWGSATTGGADTTGASPWSDLRTVTYKTIPVTTITTPANSATVTDSALKVTVTFSQSESATFVKTQLQLLQGTTVLESLDSSLQVGITMATPVQNGVSYTVKARVQDSNGLWSNWVTNAFSVTYLSPVPAVVVVSYLSATGYGQLSLTIAAPTASQSAATKITITRKINGIEESIVKDYPATADMTFLDTTPTINGTNSYTFTTLSSLGSTTVVTADLVTAELRRAFLSKGTSFTSVGVFGANLSVDESLSVASTTIEAAGRIKPIGLYGVESLVQLKVDSFIYENFGSTIAQLRAIILLPGKACYRDSSGRRVFGAAKGSISYKKATRANFSFTITETS